MARGSQATAIYTCSLQRGIQRLPVRKQGRFNSNSIKRSRGVRPRCARDGFRNAKSVTHLMLQRPHSVRLLIWDCNRCTSNSNRCHKESEVAAIQKHERGREQKKLKQGEHAPTFLCIYAQEIGLSCYLVFKRNLQCCTH